MTEQPTSPPPQEFFDTPRPPAGEHHTGVALGPLQIEISGLDASQAAILTRRYGPYAIDSAVVPDALRFELGVEDRDYFFEPVKRTEFTRVFLEADGPRIRYLSYRLAGWFDLATGRGQALLAGGEWEPFERAIENLVRVAVAWMAAERGGMLVHAASAVWKEQGYLFYGESGAGKSTLSACNRRARIVSDDLSLLLPGDNGQLELIGSPFRGTYEEGPPVQGRFPLRAGFRLVQAAVANVKPVNRARALSELVGNLPFLAEAFGSRPDLFAAVDQAFADIPLSHLHFAKDESYWDAIEAAGLA